MFKKRFLRGLAMGSILLVSLTISSFTLSASPYCRAALGSLYQRHAEWSGLAQFSNTYHLDCFRRTYKFDHSQDTTRNQKDASNYFMNLS